MAQIVAKFKATCWRVRRVTAQRHVLATVDTVGGIWTYAIDLAKCLALQGFKTTLAVLGPPPSTEQQKEAAAVGDMIVSDKPLDWLCADPQTLDGVASYLEALASDLKVDLIHLNHPTFAAFRPFGQPVLGALHSCLATWWKAVKGTDMPPFFAQQASFTRRGLEQCDLLMCPTHSFARVVRATHGLTKEIATVHNGRTMPQNGGENTSISVFTAGRLWDEGKNLSFLDKVAAQLRWPSRAAGPVQSPTGDLLRLSHIEHLGNLTADELADELRRRPVFVSMALYEPFGLAVLEAAQAGCALVLSDIPTFRELWSEAAILVTPDDEGELLAQLHALLTDATYRDSRGRAARVRAKRYSVEKMAQGTAAIYQRLIDQGCRA